MPDKDQCPGVVLVPGSGPNDRDETIGPNKIFWDIAYFLGENGVASLRYDKRTYTYKEKFSGEEIRNMTIREEVVDDAVEAVSFLINRPEIDQDGIYLLGHSLGGWLAPLIANGCAGLQGIIMAAPPGKPLDELIIDQINYQYEVTGEKKINPGQAKKFFRSIKNGECNPDEKFLGAYPAYCKSCLDHNPLEAIASIETRALLLFGGNDCQVPIEHYEIWKERIEELDKDFEIYLFPGLNHLFHRWPGQSIGLEYFLKDNVDKEVLQKIVSWINDK